MSIEVACQCGKVLKAKDEHAGLKAKCPRCGTMADLRTAGCLGGCRWPEWFTFLESKPLSICLGGWATGDR